MATLSPHGRANLPPLETASTSDGFDHSAAMIPGTPGHMAQLGMNGRMSLGSVQKFAIVAENNELAIGLGLFVYNKYGQMKETLSAAHKSEVPDMESPYFHMGKQDRPDDGDEMIVVNLPNVDPVEAHVMYVGLLCFGRGYTKEALAKTKLYIVDVSQDEAPRNAASLHRGQCICWLSAEENDAKAGRYSAVMAAKISYDDEKKQWTLLNVGEFSKARNHWAFSHAVTEHMTNDETWAQKQWRRANAKVLTNMHVQQSIANSIDSFTGSIHSDSDADSPAPVLHVSSPLSGRQANSGHRQTPLAETPDPAPAPSPQDERPSIDHRSFPVAEPEVDEQDLEELRRELQEEFNAKLADAVATLTAAAAVGVHPGEGEYPCVVHRHEQRITALEARLAEQTALIADQQRVIGMLKDLLVAVDGMDSVTAANAAGGGGAARTAATVASAVPQARGSGRTARTAGGSAAGTRGDGAGSGNGRSGVDPTAAMLKMDLRAAEASDKNKSKKKGKKKRQRRRTGRRYPGRSADRGDYDIDDYDAMDARRHRRGGGGGGGIDVDVSPILPAKDNGDQIVYMGLSGRAVFDGSGQLIAHPNGNEVEGAFRSRAKLDHLDRFETVPRRYRR